jgi:hypothetical protein
MHASHAQVRDNNREEKRQEVLKHEASLRGKVSSE